MKIYVVECISGVNGLYHTMIYVGKEYKQAVQAIKDYKFESNYKQLGYITIWINGKLVNTNLVFEG